MKRKNFTNKQIHEAWTLNLIFRMNCLHAKSEQQPQDDGVPLADIWEATTIIKEIRRRFGRLGAFCAGEMK
ncbi:MAG: hypothetical protein KAV87_54225 [Desulfobacteraceae bacterium]|nr:hypothetical protein [Desulfobacteraceae bacterium]